VNKNIQEMSVVELKVLAFDLDNEGKRVNANYQAVINVLNQKLNGAAASKPQAPSAPEKGTEPK